MLLFNHWVMSRSFVVPWTVAHQATLSKGLFPRQEYWSWSPFPSPGDLSNLHAICYYTLPNYIMRFITQPAYHTTLFAKCIPCLVFDSWLHSVALNWRYTSYWVMVFLFTCVKKNTHFLCLQLLRLIFIDLWHKIENYVCEGQVLQIITVKFLLISDDCSTFYTNFYCY